MLVVLEHTQDGKITRQRALVCTEHCYVLRQIAGQASSVILRIQYASLIQILPSIVTESGYVKLGESMQLLNNQLTSSFLEFLYEDRVHYRSASTHLWCTNRAIADRLADRVRAARQRFQQTRHALSYVLGQEAPI